jgi:methyltransferase (TIGR00027 family)
VACNSHASGHWRSNPLLPSKTSYNYLKEFAEGVFMTRAAAKTGINPMALIAIEQHFPPKQRIVEDGLAYRMLPAGSRIFVKLMRPNWARNWMIRLSEKSLPGIWGGMLCRKRYVDDKLIESVDSIDVVINLGAGFDTRAYRLAALASIPIWEVDQLEIIASKRARLLKTFRTITSNINLVPIDFDNEDLGSVLASNGYPEGKRTFFIWEAVTQYLTEAGIRSTFNFLAKAPTGSRLIFTYVRKDFLDGRNFYGSKKFYKDFVLKKIFIFGMEPELLPAFIQEYGWKLIQDIGYDELAPRYIKPTGRPLTSTPIERIVFAEKL